MRFRRKKMFNEYLTYEEYEAINEQVIQEMMLKTGLTREQVVEPLPGHIIGPFDVKVASVLAEAEKARKKELEDMKRQKEAQKRFLVPSKRKSKDSGRSL